MALGGVAMLVEVEESRRESQTTDVSLDEKNRRQCAPRNAQGSGGLTATRYDDSRARQSGTCRRMGTVQFPWMRAVADSAAASGAFAVPGEPYAVPGEPYAVPGEPSAVRSRPPSAQRSQRVWGRCRCGLRRPSHVHLPLPTASGRSIKSDPSSIMRAIAARLGSCATRLRTTVLSRLCAPQPSLLAGIGASPLVIVSFRHAAILGGIVMLLRLLSRCCGCAGSLRGCAGRH